MLHHLLQLAHLLLQRNLEARLEEAIPELALGLEDVKLFAHLLVGVGRGAVGGVASDAELAVLAVAVLLGLVEAKRLDDAVGDDDFVNIDELKVVAAHSKLLDCEGEGRGLSWVVEVVGQPHGHDEEQFAAEQLERPDGAESVVVVLLDLDAEDGEEVGDELFVDV